ncbi:MAG: metallophosphoesterase [Candidatus Bilamarchaeaceae archaeon]
MRATVRFLYNEPAVFYKSALIIGDVHFGIESKLRERGIVDNKFSERLEKKIEALLDRTKAKRLIINGDVKEQIGIFDNVTAEMLKQLNEIVEVIIVRGNHDGGIEESKLCVVPSDGFSYYGLGLFHGHSWPSEEVMQCASIISAHQHPQIELKDKLGKRHIEPVWLFADANPEEIKKYYENFNKKSRLILMPAFNPLVGSSLKPDEHLGPVLNNNLFKLSDALVFRFDGSLIGRLGSLE